MAEPKGLKNLLKSVNKRDSKAMGLAVEGKHFVSRRNGETKEEFEKRKKEFEQKKKMRKLNRLKDEMMGKKQPPKTLYRSKK
jgi:hypothetical protein